LFTLSFVVFNFLATATTPAVAAAVGARNSKAAGEVVYQATVLAVLLGLGVAFGLHGNAPWMLSVMGSDPAQGDHMHDLAMQYLMIRWVVADCCRPGTVQSDALPMWPAVAGWCLQRGCMSVHRHAQQQGQHSA
jgi:hypothetical protein